MAQSRLITLLVLLCAQMGSQAVSTFWDKVKCPEKCKCSLEYNEWLEENLRTVDCSDQQLTYFPENTPAYAQALILTNNQLSRLSNGTTDEIIYLHDLVYLDLSNNRLESLGSDSRLRELYNLKVLDLSNNRLNSLVDYAFAGLFNLERLTLANNQIHNAIGEQAFHGLLKLRTLELSANSIEYIQLGWWISGTLKNLRELKLDGNQLGFLQADSFEALSNLRHLDIGRNKISRVNQNAFKGLNSLQTLNFDYNLLQTLPKESLSRLMLSLQSLNINGNPIRKFKSRDFSNLRELKDLSCNYMPRLEIVEKRAFERLPQLVLIELHDNPHLSYLDGNAFFDTPQVTHIFLHNNNLTALNRQIVDDTLSLEEISFYGNPLACDCNAKWLKISLDKSHRQQSKAWTTNNKVVNIRDADKMICNSPPEHTFKLFSTAFADKTPDETCAPSISILTSNASLNVLKAGDSILLDCKAIGSPKPKIFWLSPAGLLVSQNIYNEFGLKTELRNHGEMMIIKNLRDQDSGVYTCIAENDQGRVSASIDLTFKIVTVMDHSIDLHLDDITANGAKISWTGLEQIYMRGRPLNQQGMLKLYFNAQDHFSPESVEKNYMLSPTVNNFALKHLKPATSYEICLAVTDEHEVALKFQCIKFQTKSEKNVGKQLANMLNHEQISNLSIGIALSVMVVTLIALGLVVTVLKKRNRLTNYKHHRHYLSASNLYNFGYVVTPRDCRSFVFENFNQDTAVPNVYAEFQPMKSKRQSCDSEAAIV